ncbi:ABC-type multidrug transport system, ATPase and permease component [Geosmithia morbida]|uniref:ABC-type multidrug transport system, ATPase and permease component n=1 Tax=Geosmithia morbida TaxID=1094350 RepID=A0A9P4YT90_9HYPO|nr:ABC-type multidrug transport system, ATPase and permease component [Geosmithia morbida]KAF4121630.1 ABC-type multidrug transport system, ATPase and permease component [Geosmithia morbida]
MAVDSPVVASTSDDAVSTTSQHREQRERDDVEQLDGKAVGSSATSSKPRFTQTLVNFFQLLVCADPTWVDYTLLVVGTISAAASGVPFPLMGIIFGKLLDDINSASCEVKASPDGNAQDTQHTINKRVLILVYLGIAVFVLIYVYVTTWGIFSRRVERRLRDRYFQMLLHQDASFFDTRQAGELSSRLNADIQAVQSGTSEKVGMVLACVSFFITAYIVSFISNWKLACMLLSLIPAFLLLAAAGSAYTQKFTVAMSDALASASSVAQETLSNIAVVQAFSAGPRLESKFASRMHEAQAQGIKKAVAAAVQAGGLYFIAFSANALSYWQGSRQIADAYESDDGATAGKIYTVIFLLVDACVVLGSIAPVLPILGSAAASYQKLREDMEAPVAIDSSSPAGTKLDAPIQGAVSFKNVTFAYRSRPDRPVLKNVSFECPAGKYTALVGLSGSGKSTVAGLTARLYDPAEGTITLDGHDLHSLNIRNLRSHMSLVQQEPSLLDRSIVENIALGLVNSPQDSHQRFQPILLGATLSQLAAKVRAGEDLAACARSLGQDVVDLVENVRYAAGMADAAGFIEKLEFGYGTLVGTGGKLVSGGQRQRIALARAIIRDPQILILDEATAALDSVSERRIQAAVESIAKNRTLISIAHRLSTIKNADNIIVMNQGSIIEQGTHLELMALNGSYAGMVRLQDIAQQDKEYVPSQTSTTNGDVEAPTSEKGSIEDDKAVATAGATEADAEKSGEDGNPATSDANNDAEELDSQMTGWTVVRRFGRMIRPNILALFIAMFAAVIVGGNYTASGLIFGHTIGGFSPCNSTSKILNTGLLFGGMYFMLAVVELFAYTFSWSGFGYVTEKLLYKIRVLSFRSLYQQDLHWHQTGGRTASSLLSVITADAAAVGSFSGSIVGTIFSISVNLIVAIVLSHILSWKIAVVCLVTVPILLGSGAMQLHELAKFENKHAGAFSKAVGITVETVNSFKTISSLSLEQEVFGCYKRTLAAPRKEMMLAILYTDLWLAIAHAAGPLIYAFAYWWGSTRITKGEATETDFFVILVSMLVSAQLWGQVFTLAPEVSRARSAASRILSLLDKGSVANLSVKESQLLAGAYGEKDLEAEADASSRSAFRGDSRGSTVTFKNVAFSYPARPHITILHDLSFTIESGQFCGLVGPSGAGKSTIMAMVQRMYTPTSGTVEIDGVDICAREDSSFRDDIALVPQDSSLFEGTIKFNVGLGARKGCEASQEDIEAACKLANIHDTIVSLPDKYDTECGPNGSRLSGGQRQRLAIARALVRKPRLLLLDESTSALDAESEKALQEGLERAAQGITVIAITHRLHTVRKADVIFVVEGGQVAEKGRHDELVETSELYRVNALQQMLDN